MKSNRKFTKNSAAFTGLEAAIVLIAFVVVAAVFSYVMLGAGFFTSQKSKEVVHTGVDQATASLQIAGDIIGIGDTTDAKLDGAIVTLSLTAGNNPVDMGKLVVSYTTATNYEDNIYSGATSTGITTASDIYNAGNSENGGYQWVVAGNGDALLDKNEKVQLNLPFPTDARHNVLGNAAGNLYATDERVGANEKVTLDIKPATGANLQITFTVPPTIDSYMVLL
ncbi:archaellin/type IV pilin N-terminal domain-containing protein [Methanocella sp. MCL-LM]|uniref:archaellin/type IV pilin N-terminal domain-containing protein n=1 Tax=Methanocella sp. MCL-LM TaxID=3412035 RepID=UPI003C79503D